MEDQRFVYGETVLKRVSKGDGQSVIEGLQDISPELGRFIVEFAYGDVIARSGIDLK